jgi:hypothetical protein
MVESRTTPCGHNFEREAIEGYFSMNGNSPCPCPYPYCGKTIKREEVKVNP